ncbi:MAG: glycosyltransferase family 39 protein [Bacteroidota bacterium]
MNWSRYKNEGIIALVAALFFVPFLGGVHLFDWDEINFAEISREMLLTEDYLRIYVDFQPFWEKPPLFFWLQALAMKAFGIGEFAARLPNALCGVLTLVLLYRIGKHLYNERFGWLWAGVYLGSLLPHLYFRSGIIDPFFNLFIFLGLYLFLLFYWKKEQFSSIQLPRNPWTYLFWAGFIIGLGIITKGPVAYLIAGLTLFVYWIFQRLRFYVLPHHFLFFSFAASLVTLSWYGLETWKNGPWFISEFNKYQYRLFSTPDAGHRGFPGYHFVVLLIGCFPASIFALRAFFRKDSTALSHQKDFKLWMSILFWVVLILFSIVKSKIVHYSSMCYFPLTFLATLSLHELLEQKQSWNRWLSIGLWSIGGLFVVAFLLLPFVGNNARILLGLFDDPFAEANLHAEVHWSGWELLPGVLLFFVLFYAIQWMRGGQLVKGIRLLLLGSACFVALGLYAAIGNIEGYSQRAAIEFFESKADEDCYIRPMGYKSYGHLFYARKRPVTNEKSYDLDWLMSEEADKPVYFITKIHLAHWLVDNPALREVGRKNGFVFFEKKSNPK